MSEEIQSSTHRAENSTVEVKSKATADRDRFVEINDLTKVYDPQGDAVTAIDDLDLYIEEGEFVTLLGPSGCGKSTLLECLAGYLEPTDGEVHIEDSRVTEPGADRGVVFQENRLFPWKTIRENIQFGPNVRDDAEPDPERVEYLLEKTGLQGHEDDYPDELSGGMQQRAELCRLLANNPKIMLMDEPFSALDAMTKELMQEMLLDIWDEEDRTVFFVTHDVEEAIFLADRVVVMTARPGEVKGVIDVDLDRPRDYDDLTTDKFTEYKRTALDLIHDEAEEAMEQGEA
ncbi:MAG: NitT/TauT family transport system ATP-binding protein [Halobacteriales archaeon]|jgi:NitT/TauT family transport system ATP-binding protein